MCFCVYMCRCGLCGPQRVHYEVLHRLALLRLQQLVNALRSAGGAVAAAAGAGEGVLEPRCRHQRHRCGSRLVLILQIDNHAPAYCEARCCG